MVLIARLLILLIPALLLAAPSTSAWAPETRVRMIDEAVRFMPATLRLALENNREALLRGMLGPQTQEDDPAHKPSWDGGTLEARTAAEARALLETLETPRPFSEIAAAFGRLAHFVMDAGFPPGVGDTEGADHYDHFVRFCESRREKFPLVFYGHQEPHLDSGDFLGFARAVAQRAREDDRQLARAYAAAGDPPHPAAFDDRSVPFAVGSLAYSHTTTDIVRVWVTAWRLAGGDMGQTPYMQPRSGITP